MTLDADEVANSFDVTSLNTIVPVKEAIQEAAERLYTGGNVRAPSVDKETFIILATLSCTNVLMQAHEGAYQQIDDLAMESPPLLSNIWLSKCKTNIRHYAKLF